MIKILGVKIIDRIKEAGLTQEILSRHSAAIITRLGFHEVTDNVCSREACLILHLNDKNNEAAKLRSELEPLGGIIIRELTFNSADTTVTDVTGIPEVLCLVLNRKTSSTLEVQKLLTMYGCYIRTRLGVNESFFGEPAGLIILELTGDEKQRVLLANDLRRISGVQVRSLVF
jgi:hypothetical protein